MTKYYGIQEALNSNVKKQNIELFTFTLRLFTEVVFYVCQHITYFSVVDPGLAAWGIVLIADPVGKMEKKT